LRAGLSVDTISRILKVGRASGPTLYALATHFGVEAAELRAFGTRSPWRRQASEVEVKHIFADKVRIRCAICGTTLQRIGRRRFCNSRCRKAAWRRKHPVPRKPRMWPGMSAESRGVGEANHSIGEFLRVRRMTAGRSWAMLAKRAGVSSRAIHYLEHGVTHPHRNTVLRLCMGLELSADEQSGLLAVAKPTS